MASNETAVTDFGLLIAYVLPGFVALWGASYVSAPLRTWIGAPPADAPTLAGFLYMTVASIAAGLTVSTVRWLVLDTVHHRTGIPQPSWDFSLLGPSVSAFDVLVQIHYRYYQFYGNTLIALAWAGAVRRIAIGGWSAPLGWPDLGFLLLVVVFFLGSRDTLRKYYARTGQLLGRPEPLSASPKELSTRPSLVLSNHQTWTLHHQNRTVHGQCWTACGEVSASAEARLGGRHPRTRYGLRDEPHPG